MRSSIWSLSLLFALAAVSCSKKDAEDDTATDESQEDPTSGGSTSGGGSSEGGTTSGSGSSGGTTTGENSASCVAPAAVIHMTYKIQATASIGYGTNECGSWVYETVGNANEGNSPTLALDGTGTPYIVSQTTTGGNIKLSKRNSNKTWTTQTIYTGDVAFDFAIAIDSSDYVHIAYGSSIGNPDRRLYHLSNRSGSWVRTLADNSADVGTYVSMALDSQDVAHIAHYQAVDSSKGNLRYATVSASSTSQAQVEFTASAGSGYNGTSILVDSNDKEYIAFHQYKDASNVWLHDLYVATNASGSWLKTLIHPTSSAYYGTAIVADSLGQFHVAHLDTNNSYGIMDYASGSWSAASSSPGAISGNGSSNIRLGVDKANKLHMMISQYNSGQSKFVISYATNTPGSWATTALSPNADPGSDISFGIVGVKAQNSW